MAAIYLPMYVELCNSDDAWLLISTGTARYNIPSRAEVILNATRCVAFLSFFFLKLERLLMSCPTSPDPTIVSLRLQDAPLQATLTCAIFDSIKGISIVDRKNMTKTEEELMRQLVQIFGAHGLPQLRAKSNVRGEGYVAMLPAAIHTIARGSISSSPGLAPPQPPSPSLTHTYTRARTLDSVVCDAVRSTILPPYHP